MHEAYVMSASWDQSQQNSTSRREVGLSQHQHMEKRKVSFKNGQKTMCNQLLQIKYLDTFPWDVRWHAPHQMNTFQWGLKGELPAGLCHFVPLGTVSCDLIRISYPYSVQLKGTTPLFHPRANPKMPSFLQAPLQMLWCYISPCVSWGKKTTFLRKWISVILTITAFVTFLLLQLYHKPWDWGPMLSAKTEALCLYPLFQKPHHGVHEFTVPKRSAHSKHTVLTGNTLIEILITQDIFSALSALFIY